jgi:hypothetical protein
MHKFLHPYLQPTWSFVVTWNYFYPVERFLDTLLNDKFKSWHPVTWKENIQTVSWMPSHEENCDLCSVLAYEVIMSLCSKHIFMHWYLSGPLICGWCLFSVKMKN